MYFSRNSANKSANQLQGLKDLGPMITFVTSSFALTCLIVSRVDHFNGKRDGWNKISTLKQIVVLSFVFVFVSYKQPWENAESLLLNHWLWDTFVNFGAGLNVSDKKSFHTHAEEQLPSDVHNTDMH